jgi:hypothetical protein
VTHNCANCGKALASDATPCSRCGWFAGRERPFTEVASRREGGDSRGRWCFPFFTFFGAVVAAAALTGVFYISPGPNGDVRCTTGLLASRSCGWDAVSTSLLLFLGPLAAVTGLGLAVIGAFGLFPGARSVVLRIQQALAILSVPLFWVYLNETGLL